MEYDARSKPLSHDGTPHHAAGGRFDLCSHVCTHRSTNERLRAVFVNRNLSIANQTIEKGVTYKMDTEALQTFLAKPHDAIIAINRPGKGAQLSPIWFLSTRRVPPLQEPWG